MTAIATAVDCRGQRCPAPILATAKAARVVGAGGGGLLEIAADDDAFPFDIRSWCRSSGAELVQLHSEGIVHTAVVRVPSRAPQTAVRSAPPPRLVPVAEPQASAPTDPSPSDDVEVLDCRGQRCPAPILSLARRARALGRGGTLDVLADDPAFGLDLRSWCRSSGAQLLSLESDGEVLRARIRIAGSERPLSADDDPRAIRPSAPQPVVSSSDDAAVSLDDVDASDRFRWLEARLDERPGGSTVTVVSADPGLAVELVQWAAAAGHRLLSLDARGRLRAELELAAPPASVALVPMDSAALAPAADVPQCTLLVLHNDREALLAALLVAVGAAAQGMNVMMFYTFWGLNLLRGENPAMPREKVSWAQRMFKWMMPKGPAEQKLGKLDMAGMGRTMLGSIMKRYELMDIPELMATAEEQGVRFVACTMSMQVMGITKRDLAPRANLEFGGVAAFVEAAAGSRMSLTF